MIDVLPFSFPNVGRENRSTQLKNLFLNNIGTKEEKNRWQVNQLKCHRLIIYVLPPYTRRRTSKCAAFWEIVLRTCSCSTDLPNWYTGVVNQSKFQDSGTQPRSTCHFARAIIMAVNHTVNHSIAKYCHVKGHFWVFRWRYTFASTA